MIPAKLEHLLEKGTDSAQVLALVRNPEKAEELKGKGVQLRVGDYNDYDSLVAAFSGVDKLLFVSGSEIETRDRQHENVVKAAKKANINHIAYTSFARENEIGNTAIPFIQNTHLKTEEMIKESGINYTFLQHATYMETIPMFVGDKVAETGVVMVAAQEGKSNYVLVEELAEAGAEILLTDGHINKVYPLTNPEAVSFQDVADEISTILGKEIRYVSPSIEEYQSTLKEFGVPEEYIGFLAAFSAAIAQGEMEVNDPSLETILGRKPATVRQFITNTYAPYEPETLS